MGKESPFFFLSGKVEEYMSEGVVTVEEDLPLEDALELFSRHHFHGLPVVNSRGEAVGIIRDSDILAVFMRRDPSVANLRMVKDIMSSPPPTISPQEGVHKAVEKMFSNQTRLLVVVDREKKPQAVITRTDLIKAIRTRRVWDS